MSEIAQLLAQVPLLRGIGGDDLERLARHTERVAFEADADVVEIGAPGGSLFVILEGSVRVLYPARTADFELARLGPGEFFGEMALLNDRPRSATVRAVEAVTALSLDQHEFRKVVESSPRLATHLLEALSLRIRNADEQMSNLSDQAMRDPLTGLPNRRAFQEGVTRELHRGRRYGGTFSLVLFDLDRFANINDTLGFDVGDDILRWVGRILQEHTRGADCPYRTAGEEFAVLCPNTPAETAQHLANRLVGVVGEARPPLDHELTVTMSAGWATFPQHGDSIEALYHLAGQAVRGAKRSGRNRVQGPAA